MNLLRHLTVFREYITITFKTALAYRVSFIARALAMVINDILWVFFWWIFFNRFPVIQGWEMRDLMVLYAIVMLSFGLASFFFHHRNKLPQLIAEGKLDFYLTLPTEELFHILISKSSAFAVGDIVFGIVLAAFALRLEQWPLFLFLAIISTSVWVSFGVLTGSLAFYWGNAEETSRSLFNALTSLSSYPFPMYTGAVRIILLTIIPAGFISGIPVEVIREFNVTWFLIIILFAVFFFGLAILVFKRGLRRYESGNMMVGRI